MKIFHSILFRGLAFHFFAFALFSLYYFSEPDTTIGEIVFYILFYIFGVLLIVYFLLNIRISARETSKVLAPFLPSDFDANHKLDNKNELDIVSEQAKALQEQLVLPTDRLEKQINQIDNILTYTTAGLIATDRLGNIVLANDKAFELLHTKKGELSGKAIVEVLEIQYDYSFHELLTQQPQITISNPTTELGKEEFLEIKFSTMRGDNGLITGVVALIQDKTGETQLEQRRQQFLSNVSHELRTPLTVIRSYLETLDDGALQEPKLAEEFVKTSLDETNRLIRMVNELLELTRIDAKQISSHKEVLDLKRFLTYHIERIERVTAQDPKYKDLDFPIVLDLPEEPVYMEFDPDKAGQVVDNLASNAIKYSPNGGTITIRLTLEQGWAHVSVSDEGMGIPAKFLGKIFERFYRVDGSRNSMIPGTGLGLAVVEEIVKIHGGKIYAESDGKKGTTFHILLPYDPDLMSSLDDFDDEN